MVDRQQLRRAVKTAAAQVLHHSGARRLVAAMARYRSGGRRLLIVSYHRVVEDFTGEVQRSIPGLLISKETFRRHLEELHRAGYEFQSIGQALEVMAGRRRAKKDVCVVTFDDGYRDVYQHAVPILTQMGVPAIVYLPSGLVGTDQRFAHDRLFHLVRVMLARGVRPLYDGLPTPAAVLLEPVLAGRQAVSAALDDFIGEYSAGMLNQVIAGLEVQLGGGADLVPPNGEIMSWDEVRAMAGAGVDLGAHTVGHTVLPLEAPERAEWEIVTSKREIETQTGQRIVDFAYCNGWYSDEIIRILAKHGFRSAVTTEDLPNRIGGDPFTLKRKVLWENFSLGLDGSYSSALTGCQLDDVFGALGATNAVPGRRPQRAPTYSQTPIFTEPELQGDA
jgi:peptidoglycan/xylan/chitin deacetylase (PgdA/CDA1 family)